MFIIPFSEYNQIIGYTNYEIDTTYLFNICDIETRIEANEHIICSWH